MKATVLVAQNAALELMELEIPPLGVGQILVKIEHSGICGKQIDEIIGRQGEDKYLPHLLGHEGGGKVVDIGPGVRKVVSGDNVVIHWVKGSGIDSEPPRFSHKGHTISAGWATTFSDYSIVSENRVTALPPGAKSDIMALLGCAVTTGLGIVFNDAKILPGESVCVIGAGGVGLNVIQGAALVNAYPIVAVDVSIAKLNNAMKFGATSVRADSGWRIGNFDVVIDTTGNNLMRELAYAAAHPKRGRVILAGVPHHGDHMSINSFPLHMGRRMIGSHGGSTNPDMDIPRYYALYQAGKLKLDELITARYPLDNINTAINAVRGGTVLGRCMIET